MYVCHTNQIGSAINSQSNFFFLATRGNLTLVFHKGVNSISADISSPLVPKRCLLFLVTKGNWTFLFFTREEIEFELTNHHNLFIECVRLTASNSQIQSKKSH